MFIPSEAYKLFLIEVIKIIDIVAPVKSAEAKSRLFYWEQVDRDNYSVIQLDRVGTQQARHFYFNELTLESNPDGEIKESDRVILTVLIRAGFTLPNRFNLRKSTSKRASENLKARALFQVFLWNKDRTLLDQYPNLKVFDTNDTSSFDANAGKYDISELWGFYSDHTNTEKFNNMPSDIAKSYIDGAHQFFKEYLKACTKKAKTKIVLDYWHPREREYASESDYTGSSIFSSLRSPLASVGFTLLGIHFFKNGVIQDPPNTGEVQVGFMAYFEEVVEFWNSAEVNRILNTNIEEVDTFAPKLLSFLKSATGEDFSKLSKIKIEELFNRTPMMALFDERKLESMSKGELKGMVKKEYLTVSRLYRVFCEFHPDWQKWFITMIEPIRTC